MKRMVKLWIIIIGLLNANAYDTSKNENYIQNNDKENPINATFQPPLIGKFPAPDGAPRGLCFDGTYLWCSNSGDGNSQYGAKIYKLNPLNGSVVNSYPPFGVYPNGLAWDGNYLWHSDHGTNTIYKIDPNTMSVIKSFSANFPFDLAFDGQHLYYVKGNQPYIAIIDTATGNEIGTIYCNYSSPNVRPFGLEYFPFSQPQIWTSDGNYGSNYVNEYNLYTQSWFYQWPGNPTQYPCGLAYDPVSGYLWISCWTRDSIYIYNVGSYINEKENFPKNKIVYLNSNFMKDKIIINFINIDAGKINIILCDASGRAIFQNKYTYSNPIKISFPKLQSLGKGIYFLNIYFDKKVEILKLIKD